jgi:hypothetical protein
MTEKLKPLTTEPTGDASPGAVGYGHHGYPAYADFTDLYQSHIRLQFSSRAFHPACWLWIKTTSRSCPGFEDGSGHLSLPQAVALRDALNAFITQAEQQIENGSYWPEPDEEDS